MTVIRVLVLIVLAGFAAVSVAQHEGHVPKPATARRPARASSPGRRVAGDSATD